MFLTLVSGQARGLQAVTVLCSEEYEKPCRTLSSVLLAHLTDYQVAVDLSLIESMPMSFYDQMESARAALKSPATLAVLWLDGQRETLYLLIAQERSSASQVPVTDQLMSRRLPEGGLENAANAELVAALARSCLASWLDRRKGTSASPEDQVPDEELTSARQQMRTTRQRKIEPIQVTPVLGFSASPLTQGGNWLAGNRLGLETGFANRFGTSLCADVYWPGQLPLPTRDVHETYRFSFRFSSHLYQELGVLRLGLATVIALDVIPTLDRTRERRRTVAVLGLALQISRKISRFSQLWAEVGLSRPTEVVTFSHQGDFTDRTAMLWPHVAFGIGLPLTLGRVSSKARLDPHLRWPLR
jgi:hypothetical protein